MGVLVDNRYNTVKHSTEEEQVPLGSKTRREEGLVSADSSTDRDS